MSGHNKLENYIQTHIAESIDSGWIRAYYQPVVRTMTDDISGFEALARWDDPTYGFLTPDIFIPALEKSGDIYLLDLAILEKICSMYADRKGNGFDLVPVSFNLSRIDLDIPDIHERIMDICDRYEVPHSMIHIEITESTSYQKDDELERHIKWFHRQGFEVWMDDFGSGFSTFSTLQTHSFDVIKLDMMFLRNFNDKAEKIIQSIVQLAKSMGIGTVCEGVETAEEVLYLKEIGCERMQGWYYGRPQPSAALVKLTTDETKDYETLEEQEYWNAISRIDLLTGKPEMLIEYENAQWRPLTVNRDMYRAMNEIHPEGKVSTFREVTDPESPLFKVVDGIFSQVCRTRDVRTVDYIDSGFLIMMQVEYVASLGSKTALRVRIRNIHTELEYKKNSLLEEGLVGLYSQFELVNRIDPVKDTALQIYSNASFEKVYGKGSLKAGIAEFTNTEVFEEDRERYSRFMNMDTLDARINEQGVSFIADGFRLSDKTGGYSWKIVTLLREMTGSERQYLYEIQAATYRTLQALKEEYE